MIFGLQAPKFVYSSTTYNLDYANTEPNYIQGDFIEHTSVITGKRFYILRGDYAEFTVVLNLWKYGTDAQVKAKFEELFTVYKNGYEVDFYPHREAPAIQNSSSVAVKFRITECRPIYLDTAQYRDKLLLTFKSINYIDPTKNLV